MWRSGTIKLPEKWWDALRERERLPDWFDRLVDYLAGFGWTHMDTQTFRESVSPWNARKAYCRYLAAHSSMYQLRATLWAVEPHPRGHGAHVHALWKSDYERSLKRLKHSREHLKRSNTSTPGPGGLMPLYRLHNRESTKYMGFSRLWPIRTDGRRTTTAYIMKYILKGLRGLNAPPPLPWEPAPQEPMWGVLTFGLGGGGGTSPGKRALTSPAK